MKNRKRLYNITNRAIKHRNSVRVVPLKTPRWWMKWTYVGNKWTHEMNPERVQLFRICHVIGRSKTRTGFENHMLSHTRGRLVPRQPRAFKSTTRTELTILPRLQEANHEWYFSTMPYNVGPKPPNFKKKSVKDCLAIRAMLHYKRAVWHRNSVRVVPLKAPRWRMKWVYVGNK